MLSQRVLVAALLLPLGIIAILLGGLWFVLLVALILGLAAWEFAGLFRSGGFAPSGPLILIGVLALVAARFFAGFAYDPWLVPLLILTSMKIHLFDFERGRDQAATDFALTLAGILYFGVLGSFMLLLRQLEHGQWWLLLTLPAVWIADSAAYFLGTRYGRNKMAPRLSPKKSWQGYFAGVLFGAIGAPLLLLLYRQWGLPAGLGFSLANAAILGLAMGLFPTLGDLGESMIKRQVGVKDSGTILPGHGGMFDRIDSWLWALPVAYFLITGVFLR
ncbi:MAG: phosphatidate cytidylyltransferase [Chloroflexi bacterium]|nr:phosphatidate cytidylyltransferase [Chloroflexota bacterium]MQC26202.1 phosphatidate cytidylyltransferase [Chloroflexota bacterium]